MDELDISCAELGRNLSAIDKAEEKLLQGSLSVLEEQGLYAFFLYLKAQGKDPGKKAIAECYQFLCSNSAIGPKIGSNANNDVFKAVLKLSDNLDDLIFARELLMRSLVYARYHLKAKNSSENGL